MVWHYPPLLPHLTHLLHPVHLSGLPSFRSLDSTNSLLPQDLCTCCHLCLEISSLCLANTYCFLKYLLCRLIILVKSLYCTLSKHLFSIMWLWVMSALPLVWNSSRAKAVPALAFPLSSQYFPYNPVQSGSILSFVGRIREHCNFPLPGVFLKTVLHV